ncbi:uncharacterized protein CIMG_05902 [Coccidioides immitis RS]|uniref:Uncharacterized protein n=4 Tax=Coccidioides immitis TaxID=5501 RepID=J3K712_COCIM|nr:uncharacterized protein CIMG_05902 [Coccidioides immitis RS]EAS30423.3 hypothetical protein CIMG_05902 [Coccidioides immitis RS]KMP02969.1 hypothetical protein CIRG_02661 [Coccidioides immitis RMSCC 2394]KMU77413.1 hypothetical protein CISG_06660 [Coccidioides immitis RMSCC 3703]KMU90756.1 hypothetical protein CIHG_08717 [Coccidioides immitis H538.4]
MHISNPYGTHSFQSLYDILFPSNLLVPVPNFWSVRHYRPEFMQEQSLVSNLSQAPVRSDGKREFFWVRDTCTWWIYWPPAEWPTSKIVTVRSTSYIFGTPAQNYLLNPAACLYAPGFDVKREHKYAILLLSEPAIEDLCSRYFSVKAVSNCGVLGIYES